MGNEIRINSNLKSLKEKGFVNYFESECFEINRRLSMHFIGKNVLMEQWLEVRHESNYFYFKRLGKIHTRCFAAGSQFDFRSPIQLP